MNKVNIKNKKALFNYEILEKFESGIQLLGTEIKSIRNGKSSINEAYCVFQSNEIFIQNMHISPYELGGFVNHEPLRRRKLLLHRLELDKIKKKIEIKGFSIIPLRLYISESGYAKIQIAVAKGKKMYDKREDIKLKDSKREIRKIKI